ncbi:MinD/ParA family protein [Oleidesulfovibrio alaskensis]|jgi:flagellar biosynthesis protein FlhG|uniref:MinD/ParA family protein n=1 Tax=Oleidesulfovibrio alaskensis TaxID=58180 RepID=UPI00040E4EBA|nr:MinD/ParA family protein [Oleidesulfovibrio alaskensis]MBG0772628.1 MinD/ParA family protein [Oleidesulfovibrio alaskensis]MBL3582983.1 MinD/ParA family protein [Oleidesulfovibrio alaskensis]
MSAELPLVFSVTSGKGGVGKTNMSVNIACCLSRMGKRVVLLDADLGLANVDVVLGLAPPRNLFHLFHEGADLGSILCETPYGFRILPASSGVGEMLSLSTGQKLDLLEAMDVLEDSVDYLLVDTGAGINDNVLYFNIAAQERIVVLTPEPTSLTDAYALIKVMKLNHGVEHFKVLVNMAGDMKAAREVFSRLYKACDHFLSGVSLDLLGYVPRDRTVRRAVVEQTPFCVLDSRSPASLAVQKVAETVQTWDVSASLDGNIKFFWKKLLFR